MLFVFSVRSIVLVLKAQNQSTLQPPESQVVLVTPLSTQEDLCDQETQRQLSLGSCS